MFLHCQVLCRVQFPLVTLISLCVNSVGLDWVRQMMGLGFAMLEKCLYFLGAFLMWMWIVAPFR